MKHFYLYLSLSLSSLLMTARYGTAQTLLADINPTPRGANPQLLRTALGGVVFVANSKDYGTELFYSDGTANGTRLILDAAKGKASSTYLALEVVNERAYILTYAGTTITLWRYNFLNDQLQALKDFPGYGGANFGTNGLFTRAGNEVFFWLREKNFGGGELWKIRGNSTQVELVSFFPNLVQPIEMGSINNTLVFSARHISGVVELWRSKGSNATTTLMKDFVGEGPIASGMQQYKDKLLFIGRDSAYGQEIWATDGITANIYLDVLPGPASSAAQFLAVNEQTLFFVAQTATGGAEVWRSDGTAARTQATGNFFSKKQISDQFKPLQVFDLGVFATVFNDSTQSDELWYFDRFGARQGKIKTLSEPGYREGKFLRGVSSANVYYFLARDPQHGSELWAIRNTVLTPPRLLKDIYPGKDSPDIRNLTPASGRLFFTAEDKENGRELWMSNSTDQTTLVKALNNSNGDSNPGNFFVHNGYLIFTATQVPIGQELWVCKGLPGSVALLGDINPGRASSFPNDFLSLKDLTFTFSAITDSLGTELWRSMVFNEKAVLVKDINPGIHPGAYGKMGKLKDKVLFGGETPESGKELWISDGTEAGTKLLKDIWPGAASSRPIFFGEAGTFGDSILLFKADNGSSGIEFWRTNGTASGTYQLADLNPGVLGSGHFPEITRIGNYAYFNLTDKTQYTRVWRSNGQTIEFVADAFGEHFVGYKGKILFNGNTSGLGRELWSYDTLTKISAPVIDINPGAFSSNPMYLRVFNDLVYFSAENEAYGRELWKSDGTAAGTKLAQDLNAGAASSNPQELLVNGPYLFFTAQEPNTGRELWYLHSSAAAAQISFDLNPGKASSNPAELTLFFGELFFRADDGKVGIELWKTAMPALSGLSNELAAVIPSENRLSEPSNFHLHPNPVRDILYLRTAADQARVSVYDLLGRQVVSTQIINQQGQIEVGRLLPGQYFVKCYDGQGKLIKTQAFQKE